MTSRVGVGLVASSFAVLMGLGGCSKTKAECEKDRIVSIQTWLDGLCNARDKALWPEATFFEKLKLARVDLPPRPRLENGPLAILLPGKAMLNGVPLAGWKKLLSDSLGLGMSFMPRLEPPPTGTAPPRGGEPRKGAVKKKNPLTDLLGGSPTKPSGGVHMLMGRDDPLGKKAGMGFRGGGSKKWDLRYKHPVVKALSKARRIPRRGKPSLIHVAVEPATPVREVTLLLQAARMAGFGRVSFLFRPTKTPGLPTPPDPETYKNLPPGPDSEKNHQAKVTALSAEVKKWEKKGCASVAEVYASLGAASPESRCRMVARGLPKAIKKCRCARDEKPLLTIMQRISEPMEFVAAWEAQLTSPGKGPQIKKKGTKWADIAGQVAKSDPKGFDLRVPGVWFRAVRPRPQVFASLLSVDGKLDANIIRRVIRRHLQEVRFCYVSVGLAHNPKLAGVVKVAFIIGTTGRTASPKVESSTLKHKNTEACILAAIRRWKFPRPKGGIVSVKYPFRFKPPGS